MPKTIEIDTNNLKKPCLMIDGGYPKNLNEKFQGENIYVLKGGIVEFFNDIGWNMMELAEMQNPQREMFACLLYTSPSPRDDVISRMPSSA